MRNLSNMPTIPAIQIATPLQNDYQNFNPNIMQDNINNNYQIPYNNNQMPYNDYPSTVYYENSDPRIMNSNNLNYGNDMNMGINMPMNPTPNLNNNMNSSAYNKDNYTPQSRDRLRMAGNNIFK